MFIISINQNSWIHINSTQIGSNKKNYISFKKCTFLILKNICLLNVEFNDIKREKRLGCQFRWVFLKKCYPFSPHLINLRNKSAFNSLFRKQDCTYITSCIYSCILT